MKNKNSKKKKKSFWLVPAAAVVALAAWLLSQFPGLGLGLGLGNRENTPANGTEQSAEQNVDKTSEADTSAESTTAPEETSDTAESTEALKIIVQVSDETISVGDETFSDAGSLKEYILSVYKDDTIIELIDDHALKASYDVAKSVLDELGYEYTEKVQSQ